MTGVHLLTTGLKAKRLGVLRDVVPSAKTIGILLHTNYSSADCAVARQREAAARLGVQLVVAGASTHSDFESAFAMLSEQRVGALLVCASPFFNDRRNQLVAVAARYRLPAAYECCEFAVAGGLMSYGNSIIESYRQTGVYAGRILKGARPADLPVVQPTKFELVIDLKTAKALGLQIPDKLLARIIHGGVDFLEVNGD
jgi:putative ABC transport system substrate-binding protein